MVKIKKLDLINFQSHKFSSLDFDDGLNVIVGPSDNGKTSILRAIRWVLFNEPQGMSMLRNNEDFVSVRVYFNNDYSVERKRSKKENLYIIHNEKTGEVKEFNSLRTGLPPEVLDIIKIRKVSLDKNNEINFNIQFQHDGPFMFSYTSTQKSALIGKMYNLDVVDKAIDETNKDIKSQKSDIKRLNEELKDLEEKIKVYDDIEKDEELLKRREKFTNNIEASVAKLDNINTLKAKLLDNQEKNQFLKDKIKDFDKVLSSQNLIDKALKDFAMREKYITYKAKYTRLLDDILKTRAIYEKSKTVADNLNLDATVVKSLDKYKKLLDLRTKLKDVTASIDKGRLYIKDNNDKLNNDLREYTKILVELKKCPYCNSDIDREHLDKIIKEYL